MAEIISRCGFRCDQCPAFKGNNNTPADQIKTAAGWSRFFGLKMSPDKIICNGCLSNECVGHDLPDSECPIKPCVLERGMNTCADCFDYPCEKLMERIRGVDEVISKFKGKISQEEYDTFIAPYDSRKTLDEIRDRRVDRID
ncbi:MAG TPA: DUF3795 domain-containing protein [Candidatus Acidoferrales bacterium]|nr:DUF3795 domain-containing protein [Candidatus Acidoferrales bacterium]